MWINVIPKNTDSREKTDKLNAGTDILPRVERLSRVDLLKVLFEPAFQNDDRRISVDLLLFQCTIAAVRK